MIYGGIQLLNNKRPIGRIEWDKNTVQVIKLVAQGTIEEKMHELQESKKNLIAEVIEREKRNCPQSQRKKFEIF